MSQEEEPKEASGCLWKGCLGVIVVGVLLSLAFAWGAYTLYSQMAELTSNEPAPVPEHLPNPEAWQAFQKKMNVATTQWQAGQPATLEVTAEDLNNTIQLGVEQQTVGKYFYEIKNGEVKMHVSVPLAWIEGQEDRYFNGLIGMVPKIENGQFLLEITTLRNDLGDAPPQFMETQKYFDWTGWLEQIGWKEQLNALDSLEIEEGKLILRKD